MFKSILIVVLLLVSLLVALVMPVQAQTRVCNPFTTTPDPGMLALGTEVSFTYNQSQHTGTISAYYIASCFPGAPVLGLDAQAYVITWASLDGSQAVVNGSALQVASQSSDVSALADGQADSATELYTTLNPCRQPYCNPICSKLPQGLACPTRKRTG